MTMFMLAIFLIGIWSVAFYTSHMLRKDMQHLLGEQQFSTVSLLAALVNRELDDRLKSIEKTAKEISQAILDNPADLQALMEHHPIYQSLFNGGAFVTVIDGTAIASIPLSAERLGVKLHGQRLHSRCAQQDEIGELIGGFNRLLETLKQRDDALRESDENFRSMFENNSVAIAIIEPDSTISMVNEEYCKVSGYIKQEVIGMSWTQQIPSEDLERLKEFNRRRLINPEDAPDKYEFTFYHKNGEIRHALMSVNMLSNRKVLASFLDITERKQAEETIRKISAAVEQSPVTIVITDITGTIEYVNPKFTETTGYTFAEAMGQNPRILKSGEFPSEAYKELWDTILAGDVWRGEFHNKKKNGELFWEQASISPIRDAHGTITSFVAVKEDITDRKRIGEELIQLNETLELRVSQEVEKNLKHERLLIQQSRLAAMGEMIGNIAHQWRQPLNALGLLLFNIKDAYQFDTLDAAYLEQAVADGRRMVQKMSTTISDFSNFFRPNKEIITFSALEQIKEAISLVESSFQNSNISIYIDARRDLKLLGFPNEYSQVLLNLLSNAKDAILACNKTLPGRVNLTLTEQDGQGCISVCDNGGGIEEDILDRIFDPYFSTKGKGSGIGLYMSKMIIERNMNGSIAAKNIEGGVEFSVCTPLM
jgi:PAS domain S-box-containing protein